MKLVLDMNAAALEEECLRQMDVIDSNLGLFHDPAQQKDDNGSLLPLVRMILQEKYACEGTFPAGTVFLCKRFGCHRLR